MAIAVNVQVGLKIIVLFKSGTIKDDFSQWKVY